MTRIYRSQYIAALILAALAGAVLEAQPGTIAPVAGNGTIAFSSPEGVPATSVGIGLPMGVAVDGSGNVYFADVSQRVRKVTASTGIMTTVAGGGFAGAIAEGMPATSAGLVFPANSHIGLAVDSNGNLYIADPGINRVQKVDTSGIITTVAGTGTLGSPGFSGDGGKATAAQLQSPEGVALDSAGNIYIVDTGNGRIRKVDTNGIITTVAGMGNGVTPGDGGPALSAQFSTPTDVAVDAKGNIYIADSGNRSIRKVDASTGKISNVASGSFGFCSLSSQPAAAADVGRATGLAVDSAGNVYIADESADCVQELETNNTITAVAGGGLTLHPNGIPATSAALGSVWAVAVDSAANIYLTDTSGFVYKVTARTVAPSALPMISGVVNGASFLAGISSNCWVTIRGTNLAPTPDTWDKSIAGGVLPTSLDGVTVSIAGVPAYVQYISQNQINVVSPPGLDGAGPVVQVVVTTPAGASQPFSVTLSTYTPALFLWPNGQPVATHTDFSWAVLNGTFAGTKTVAAKPGETIILWGTGFGPTSPAVPAGFQVPATATYSTTSLPALNLDFMPVTVYGAALATGFAALYQIAFQVPNFPDGDYPLNGSIGGVPILGTATLSIRH